MRTTVLIFTLILSLLISIPAMANSVGSSTIEFEGTLTDNGDGSYSGVIPMIVGGAYDIYAEEGGTAWFGNDSGTGPVWTSQAIGADHDAWPTWNPDTPDWYQYSLELYVDSSTDKWAVRNHAGATETNPWYDEGEWGAGGIPAMGVPMSGIMDYSYLYAAETDVGAYMPATGTPEIPGGAAGQGGGPAAWDMDWSWGSEVVPMEYSGFDVDITALGGGVYHVTLTPAAPEDVFVDDDFDASIPGWGATHFDLIQDGVDAVADGGTVNVAAGSYVETVLVEKPLSLLGATAGINKNGYTVPADYAWDPAIESIISHPNAAGGYVTIVDIYDVSDVTFDGFVVEELGAVANLNSSLVRVYAHSGVVSNIVLENNIIGPNTNVISQDGAQGRMGLYLVNHPYSDKGIEASSFSHNKLFDCKGNGDNLFLWTSYYAYGAPGPASMAGTVIDDNEIYGSHRSGIETAGGFSDLVISNNNIYGNSGLPGDDPDFLKYGHGIQLIRGSSDKVSDPLTAYGPVDLTIVGNHIHDNQKCGIYMGPKNDGIVIDDNVIHDNGWDGVMVDLVGNYWNPQFESPPISEQYACYDCSEDISGSGNSIYDNGLLGNPIAGYGVQVNGTPTNGFVLDGDLNWWGDAGGPTTGRAGDAVTDNVDYSPWFAAAPGASPMPIGTDDSIQDAINAASPGATITVGSGNYAERLNINRSLDLIGPMDGVDPTVAGARTNPANEAIIDITGIGVVNPNVAVEIPLGVTDVTVSGFTVKGSPTSHYADESVLRIWDDDVVISDNILDGFAGVIYKGADGLDVLRNRITVNKTGVVLQPGVSTDAELSGNTISLGSSPGGGESAIYATSVTGLLISGNTATGFVNGKGATGSNVTDVDIVGNTFTGNNDAVSFWGTTTFLDIVGNDLSNNLRHGVSIKGQDISITGNVIGGNGDTGVNIDRDAIDTQRVTVNNNSLVGNTNYGIKVNTALVTETVDGELNWWGSATGPTHTGNPTGAGDASTDGVDYDPWIGASGSENIVCVPDPLDLNIAASDGTIDVDYLGGGGGMMFSYSITVTWNPAIATLTGITEGNLLSDAGGTTFFTYGPDGAKTIDCALHAGPVGVTGPGTLFTLDFDAAGSGVSTVDLGLVAFRDNGNQPLYGFYEDDGLLRVDITAPAFTGVSLVNLTLGHTDEFAKDGDNLQLTAAVTDDYGTLTTAGITADLSTLLESGGVAVPADMYDNVVATWTIPLAGVTLAGDGLKTVTITATDWLGNPASDSDDITVDNTPPDEVTGVVAAPAHNEVVLVWDSFTGGDVNPYQVEIQSNAWADYPTYDAATPLYPAGPTDGTDVWEGTGTGYTVPYAGDASERSIYYLSVIASDMALNYSTVDADGQDRATNYWLGDVATTLGTWGANGLVNAADIDKLGYSYGVGTGAGTFDARCDVGPTDNYSRLGIPEPDDFVSFEDLMIFAMNYDVVAPRIVPFLAEPGIGDLVLALSEVNRSNDGVLTLALRLEGNLGEVKGLSTELEFDGLEFLSAGLSDEMSAPVADVFFWSDAASRSAQIDLAVLGTDVTIGGSGDVAVLTFRILDDAYTVDFASAMLRGAANDELTADLEGLSHDAVPASFKLVQNTPNPFNPVTMVGYHLPSESRVTIRIFDVTGRLVTTLVDGVVEPGRHSVAWNGTSEYGESVGSGVYFCTMETPEYRGSHKMTLLK